MAFSGTTRKVYWNEIKLQVKESNLEFYQLIEKISPSQSLPLYLLTFPYGVLIGDEKSQFLPIDNQLMRLNDPLIPNELIKYLGYGKHSSPMGMVLEKQFEWYVDLPQKKLTLPIMVQKPGDFFSYTRAIDIKSKFNYSPMGVLLAMSGARSTFVVPSIGCQNKLTKLCRGLGIKYKTPKELYTHFNLFTTILNSNAINELNNWHSTIIYFSENWIDKIKNDPEWVDVQKYFYKIFSQKSMYLKNLPHYQTAYSLLLEQNNLKPNPYLFDTFKHLIDIISGEIPGFAPQISNELIPLDILQDIFSNYYGFKNATPTIMGPDYFIFEEELSQPIYYSLQFPTTRSFSPHSKKTSTMVSLRELKELSINITTELKKDNYFFSNTIIQHLAENIEISFFHNTIDMDGLVTNISEMIQLDNRFRYNIGHFQNYFPAEDSKFFRGCVSISHKNSRQRCC